MLQQIRREIAILRDLHHPYVVDLKEVMGSRDKIYMVLECAPACATPRPGPRPRPQTRRRAPPGAGSCRAASCSTRSCPRAPWTCALRPGALWAPRRRRAGPRAQRRRRARAGGRRAQGLPADAGRARLLPPPRHLPPVPGLSHLHHLVCLPQKRLADCWQRAGRRARALTRPRPAQGPEAGERAAGRRRQREAERLWAGRAAGLRARGRHAEDGVRHAQLRGARGAAAPGLRGRARRHLVPGCGRPRGASPSQCSARAGACMAAHAPSRPGCSRPPAESAQPGRRPRCCTRRADGRGRPASETRARAQASACTASRPARCPSTSPTCP